MHAAEDNPGIFRDVVCSAERSAVFEFERPSAEADNVRQAQGERRACQLPDAATSMVHERHNIVADLVPHERRARYVVEVEAADLAQLIGKANAWRVSANPGAFVRIVAAKAKAIEKGVLHAQSAAGCEVMAAVTAE
ncbi:hypothetical protein [Bradyrhizobium niftali]